MRLNATCEQPPSSLTLCLARADEFSRACVRVEKGSCAGLQVLDDLVALDTQDLTLVDAETALERELRERRQLQRALDDAHSKAASLSAQVAD